MKCISLIGFVCAAMISSTAYAGIQCPHYPVAQRLPVAVMAQKAAAAGIQVQKIEVDDGCYEIKGTDKASGQQVKNKYDMKTGQLMSSKRAGKKTAFRSQP